MVTTALESLALPQRRLIKPISRVAVDFVFRAVDASTIAATALLAYFLKYLENNALSLSRYSVAIVIGVAVGAALLHRFGTYRDELIFSRRIPVGSVLGAWAVTFCVLLSIAFLLKVSEHYSRAWAVTWFVGAGFGLLSARFLLSHWVQALADAGRFANRTVILGAGRQGRRILHHLREYGDPNTRVVGFADDRRERMPEVCDGVAVIGDVDRLIELVRDGSVDHVLIALPWTADRRIQQIVARLWSTPVAIHLAPDLAGLAFPDRNYCRVGGAPVLRLFDRPISGWAFVLKTIEDRVIASLLLAFLLPLLLAIAVAIKLDSSGPVFFRQKRFGFNNSLFDCWKFRTMHHHLEDSQAQILTSRCDPRVTRVGRFLRRTSLDELPQLINVLTGDMSLVGPRPHATAAKAEGHLYDKAVDYYAARHRVKPGITGWAQINGWRGETDTLEKIQRRVECDLFYIENWSLGFDLWILAKTVYVVLRQREAY